MLPPYINFTISPKDKDFEYSLLFSLEGLKVLWFEVITHPNKQSTFSHPIEIDDYCKKAISNSYETKP